MASHKKPLEAKNALRSLDKVGLRYSSIPPLKKCTTHSSCYALAVNESAVKAMGDDKLKLIAAELITQVKIVLQQAELLCAEWV